MGVPHLTPGTPIFSRKRGPVLVSPQERWSVVGVTRLGVTYVDARPVLVVCFPHGAHPFPAWADTHARTAIFRACGYSGIIASAPIIIGTSYCSKDVRKLPAATTRIHGLNMVGLRLY